LRTIKNLSLFLFDESFKQHKLAATFKKSDCNYGYTYSVNHNSYSV